VYTTQNRDVFTSIAYGFHVARATATLPQTATGHLFQVTGGRVLITLLFGEVTTIIQNSDPVAKITSTPTTGSAVDIASTVNLTSLEVGGLIICEGDTSALIAVNGGGGAPVNLTSWICPVGYIDLITGASRTGSVKWDLWYLPLDEGAAVAAV
jgi:hypothetical protein